MTEHKRPPATSEGQGDAINLTVTLPTALVVRLGECAQLQGTTIDEQVRRACVEAVGMVQEPIGKPFGAGARTFSSIIKTSGTEDLMLAARMFKCACAKME